MVTGIEKGFSAGSAASGDQRRTGSKFPKNGCGCALAARLIARSSLYRAFAAAYRETTGLSLALAPGCAEPACSRTRPEPRLEFCRLLSSIPAASSLCRNFGEQVGRRTATAKGIHCAVCFAGIVQAAVPVFNGPEQVATLLTGAVRRGAPSARHWTRVEQLMRGVSKARSQRVRQAYRAVRVIGNRQLQAGFRLLRFFGDVVQEHLPSWLLSQAGSAPLPVLKAKLYVIQHATEDITLREAARHAGVGVHHFCGLFHRGTGLTFTQFLARLRTERAKFLLHDPSVRVAEIAFGCGFGSIPSFNRIFKRLNGVSPTRYRRSVIQQLSL